MFYVMRVYDDGSVEDIASSDSRAVALALMRASHLDSVRVLNTRVVNDDGATIARIYGSGDNREVWMLGA